MNVLWITLWQTLQRGEGEEKLEIQEKYILHTAGDTAPYVKDDTTLSLLPLVENFLLDITDVMHNYNDLALDNYAIIHYSVYVGVASLSLERNLASQTLVIS